MPAASNTYDYVQLSDAKRDSTPLAEEVALAIVYNGLNQAVMLVSPTDLEDFAVGFSVGSGIVEGTAEIYDLKLSGSGSALYADLEISSRAFWNLKNQRRQLAGTSGCGLCGVEALEQALPDLAVLPGAPLPPAQWLVGLRERIDAFQPLGQHCGAVHAALFMDRQGELLLGREDIGRHNALDKLIGALLRQRIDTQGGLAIVTSRCSLELIQKVLRRRHPDPGQPVGAHRPCPAMGAQAQPQPYPLAQAQRTAGLQPSGGVVTVVTSYQQLPDNTPASPLATSPTTAP